ncbi:MAG: OmpA family protein [Spirochaetales bacterium]|nr:OmpA family protein [Spirochaetales bacterium]
MLHIHGPQEGSNTKKGSRDSGIKAGPERLLKKIGLIMANSHVRILCLSLTALTLSCQTLKETWQKVTWRTGVATGIGCGAGLALGAVIDEYNRKKDTEKKKKEVFVIFRKAKEFNQGKIVGLAAGCLAGLGTGIYLDLMHADMEGQFKERGITLEKVQSRSGTTEELLVKMDGDVSFDTGKADLSGVAATNVGTLKEALEKYPETQLRIWGHTDGTGSRAINQPLSENRAAEVARKLDLKSSRIAEMKGWANDRPLPGKSRSGDVRENRRVEIFILPAGKEVP